MKKSIKIKKLKKKVKKLKKRILKLKGHNKQLADTYAEAAEMVSELTCKLETKEIIGEGIISVEAEMGDDGKIVYYGCLNLSILKLTMRALGIDPSRVMFSVELDSDNPILVYSGLIEMSEYLGFIPKDAEFLDNVPPVIEEKKPDLPISSGEAKPVSVKAKLPEIDIKTGGTMGEVPKDVKTANASATSVTEKDKKPKS